MARIQDGIIYIEDGSEFIEDGANAVLHDTISFGDSVSLLGVSSSTLQDTIGLSDVLFTGTAESTLEDTISLSDNLAFQSPRIEDGTEFIEDGTEYIEDGLVGQEEALQDTISLSDSLSYVSDSISIIQDTFNLAEDYDVLAARVSYNGDSISLTDQITHDTYSSNIRDTVSLLGEFSLLGNYEVNQADLFSVDDSLEVFAYYATTIEESIVFGDNLTLSDVWITASCSFVRGETVRGFTR